MSKKNNQNTEPQSNTVKIIIITAIVAMLSAAGGASTFYFANKVAENSNKNNSSATDSTSEEELEAPTVGTEDGNQRDLSVKDFMTTDAEDEALKKLSTRLEEFKSKPRYMEVQVGDDQYEAHLINTKGERIAQDLNGTYMALFTSDNRSLRINNNTETEQTSISFNSAFDVMWTASNALHNLESKKDGYTLKYVEHNSEDEIASNVTEYVIDISGRDACILLYDTYIPDRENPIGAKLIDTITPYITSVTGKDWDPHIEVGYLFSDQDPMICYLNVVLDDSVESNWLVIGSTETADWELDSYWYDDKKFTDDRADDLAQHLVTAINDVYDTIDLDNMLNRYTFNPDDLGEEGDEVVYETEDETTSDKETEESTDAKSDDTAGEAVEAQNANEENITEEVTTSE